MTDAPRDPGRTDRLRALLIQHTPCRPDETATGEALAQARRLGPALSAEAVSAVLDAFAPDRADREVAERAAHVAGALRLTGAVPALVRCVERLSQHDAVAQASLRALERLRLEAFDRE